MGYRGVTRLITIYIGKVANRRYAIDVCPDPAEVIVGDRVVWQVQNAPRGVRKVTVGKFRRLAPAPDILLRAKKAPLVKDREFNPAAQSGLAHQTRKADIGFYKYDIEFDGNTVYDPELEIRGPKY